jgi:hypothetical protein
MTSYFPGIVLATLGLILATSTSAEGGWLLWSGNSSRWAGCHDIQAFHCISVSA